MEGWVECFLSEGGLVYDVGVSVWEWLFPTECIGCAKAGVGLCGSCRLRLVRAEQWCVECGKRSMEGWTHERCRKRWGLEAVHRVYKYDELMQKIVKAVKYRFRRGLLGECLKENERLMIFTKAEVVVPVPLHRVRENWRGFNQAQVLAEILAERWGVETVEAVRRKRATKPVAGMKEDERKKEVVGAFELVDAGRIRRRRVVVVDDVVTTGSTMKEVAKVLKRGGARWVGGWALAG